MVYKLCIIKSNEQNFKGYFQMRIFKRFSNQISKGNIIFCTKKTEIYIYEKTQTDVAINDYKSLLFISTPQS